MKKIILAWLLIASSLLADPPTTGQFLFQQKPSSGPFTQFGVTPVTNEVFGWDGTKVVMLSPGGGISWGSITGTLSSQTDLQTALNALQNKTGTLALGGFGSITGTLSIGNLPGNVQTTNGALAFAGFSSITGQIGVGNLASTVVTPGTINLGNGSITLLAQGLVSAYTAPTNLQTTDGVLALGNFSNTTGVIRPSNGGLGNSITVSLGSMIYGASAGAATGLPGNSTSTKKFLTQVGTGSASAAPAWNTISLSDIPGGVLLTSNNLTDVASVSTALNNLLPSQSGNSGKVLTSNGTAASWVTPSATVTSVALTAPGVFSVSGSPVTTSGTLALSLTAQTANEVWSGPTNGSAATPTFRSLVIADIPDISATYLTNTTAAADYQPLSANLTALAATSGTNTLYYRSAANTWTPVAFGSNISFSGGTLSSTAGGGSVTSVALALPSFLAVSGSPITSSGTITATLANQSINTFFAGPGSGSAGAPVFRSIVAADVPDISASYLTPATAAADYQPLNGNLTALAALAGTNNIYYRSASNTWTSVTIGTGLSFTGGTIAATGTGTVSSVGLSLPGIFSVSGSPVTTTGTLTATIANESANEVWGGPVSGSAAAPAFRFLVSADIPDLSATYLTPATAAADYQPLNGNLTSLASASTNNSLYYRVSSGTWAPVTIGSNITLSGGTLAAAYSVGLTVPSIFSVSGSPVTTSGTLAMTINNANANTFLSGPTSGAAATPTFRNIAVADVPSLASLYVSSTTTQTANFAFMGPTTGGPAAPAFRALIAADIPDLSGTYQPLDADLTALAALTGTNNIYYRSAANTWTSVAIGAGLTFSGGTLSGGSVTSVALSLPAMFTVSGSPVTSSGTLTATLANQNASAFLVGPTSGFSAPTFRAVTAGDVPIDIILPSQTGNAGKVLITNGTNSSWAPATGTGTVTSVDMTVPTFMAVTGNPITAAGTLSITLQPESANTVFAGPTSGGATTPSYRALVAADLPLGTTAGGNAAAGAVGEYVAAIVPIGSAVGLTTVTTANVTSISLTAGDWDVEGSINYVAAVSTMTAKQGAISTTSAALPTDGSEVYSGVQMTLISVTDGLTLPRKRVNVTGTTTVYLVAQATFSAGTVSAFGTINARRAR